MDPTSSAKALQQRITDEIFLALGWSKSGRLRRGLGWLFDLPTRRFSQLFSAADDEIARTGMSGGCRTLLPGFSIHLEQRGAECLPAQGPLLVVSNHPGTYDSICLGSCVRRPDLKIVVWEIPFYRALVNADRWFVYATADPAGHGLALRACIQHLQAGGALLIFGTGIIEPDPAYAANAEEPIGRWSPSIEIMLRKVPQACLSVAMASGVLQQGFAHHGLTRLRKDEVERRRLAEFMQVITQMVAPKRVQPQVRLSFAPPVSTAELGCENPGGRLMPAIQARARGLLEEHVKYWYPEKI